MYDDEVDDNSKCETVTKEDLDKETNQQSNIDDDRAESPDEQIKNHGKGVFEDNENSNINRILDPSDHSSSQELKKIISLLPSRKWFQKVYKKCYYEKENAKYFYLNALIAVDMAIRLGDVNEFKNVCKIIAYVNEIENITCLKEFCDHKRNPLKQTNLIILACKYNKINILQNLFEGKNNIYYNLPPALRINELKPSDQDSTGRTAFYYAIRSNNCDLLDILINYFQTSVQVHELDNLISKVYSELVLKNVFLLEEMQTFVENKLINIRFFTNDNQNIKTELSAVRERIDFVIQSYDMLKIEYSSEKDVDEKFIFIASSIAQNIDVLKRQLKSTYDKLPWEEMEFCLICFVSAHIKHQEINLIYKLVLNKPRILSHLENFVKKLHEEKCKIGEVDINTGLPKLKREEAINSIVSQHQVFSTLYSDFEKIRNSYTMRKIVHYIELALLSNPQETKGQLVIERALVVTGEYLKNTLESPNLSDSICEILLSSGLRSESLSILRSIRNLLSHSFSLNKRVEIENTDTSDVFSIIQSDLKKIKSEITDILIKNKLMAVRELLQKILDSDSFEEITKMINISKYVEFDKINLENNKSVEQETMEKLVNQLKQKIKNKTFLQEKLFREIDAIINSGNNTVSSNCQFSLGFAWFTAVNRAHFTADQVVGIKLVVKNLLATITPKIENEGLEEITRISSMLYKSFKATDKEEKIQNLLNKASYDFKNIGDLSINILKDSAISVNNDYEEIEHLIFKIAHRAQFKVDHVKGLEALKIKYNENKTKNTYINNKTEVESILFKRLRTLKNILTPIKLQSTILSDQFRLYKQDISLQVATEMLIFDIIEIHKNCLANNQLLFDSQCPLLVGKALRNYLAHGNALVDITPYNSVRAVFANSVKFNEEGQKPITQTKKLIGQYISEDILELKKRFKSNLNHIINQKRMQYALKMGNCENMKELIKNGVEIMSRDIKKRTSLHLAAAGGNIDIVKFLLENGLDANAKDISGQNSLYMAVANGRMSVVIFFIENVGLSIHNVDNDKKTLLHVAAKNGYRNIVEYLLKNGAKTSVKDYLGFSPVHLAIINNHMDVVKTLLKHDPNVDCNEVNGGFTPLHLAAEHGRLEIVDYLIRMNANVNAKNDNNWIPLHAAALKGCLKVVKVLLLNGSDVNAKAVNGCTPLHYAAESSFVNVVEILVEYGANVDTVDSVNNCSVLHYVSKVGNESIVKILLGKNANVDIKTIEGMTALHFAAQHGHLEIVKALLRSQANIESKYVRGATPLDFAIQGQHTEVVKCLLLNGANVNSRSHSNITPLHVASLNGNKIIVGMLIEKGANIDAICNDGNSPLVLALVRNHIDVVQLLIEKGADYRRPSKNNLLPIHLAALHGCSEVVQVLIDNKIDVNCIAYTSGTSCMPLHCAALSGNFDAVKILIENGAHFKAIGFYNYTPLHLAIVNNNTEIVTYLIQREINIDISYMRSAIWQGNNEIVKVLLQYGVKPTIIELNAAIVGDYNEIAKTFIRCKIDINENFENVTPLGLAALHGNKEIIYFLIENGAEINIENGFHPLYFAAFNNHVEIVSVLLKKGAEVNCQSLEASTPLHIAAGEGYSNVVEVLLKHGANINIKDNKNRTPLELAIANNRFSATKMLMEHMTEDVNSKGNDGWSILHIAGQAGNCDLVEYLINKGSDLHAKNSSGSKPIHIAAREGHWKLVELFLSKGLTVNEIGAADQTILHYAAIKNQLEVVQHLLEKSIDINAQDANGMTPLHIAAQFGSNEIVQLLLHNSAIYNAVDKFHRTPLLVAKDTKVIKILESTKKIFETVKLNKYLEIGNNINEGACANAKNIDHVTPLHYAAWKGYNETIESLLKNKANPNVIGKNRTYPLHYAVKFGHLKAVKLLLSYGAIYNCMDHNNKTPLYFAENKAVINLLKLIDESYENICKGNLQVIDILNTVKDVDIIKSVMNAKNRKMQSLMVTAIHKKFPKVKELKELLQENVTLQLDKAHFLLSQEKFCEALPIFENLLQKRRDIYGLDNPATLDVQNHIANVLYKQGKYEQALKLLNEINQKQTDILGINCVENLSTRSGIGLVLHRLGRDEEALTIYQDVCHKQQKILGLDNADTLSTQLHMALVLDSLNRFDEALNINEEIFNRSLQTSGTKSKTALAAQNNIAMVLTNQKRYEEALKTYNEVYKRKKYILGPHHSDTLRTLHNIGTVHMSKNDFDKALQTFSDVFEIQKSILGLNHLDTLNTRNNIANVLFAQGKIHAANKIYLQILEQRKTILGDNHPDILDTIIKMKVINDVFKLKGQISNNNPTDNSSIHVAVNDCNIQLVKQLLFSGIDVNIKDSEGRTPLHFAVNKINVSLVKLLLDNGADVTKASTKGNTPLHTAVSKGATNIVVSLLDHVKKISPRESGFLVDAQTTIGYTTALHISVQNNNQKLVVILLQYGACYDIKNAESKTPLDLATPGSDTETFLFYIHRMFESVHLNRKDKIEQLLKEKYFQSSNLRKAILYARENYGKRTLIQISQRDVAKLLLEKLRI